MCKYQYHVYNKHLSILVTVPMESYEYAEGFAKRTAMDFYGYDEDQLDSLQVEFICSFQGESVVNLKMLNG